VLEDLQLTAIGFRDETTLLLQVGLVHLREGREENTGPATRREMAPDTFSLEIDKTRLKVAYSKASDTLSMAYLLTLCSHILPISLSRFRFVEAFDRRLYSLR